MVPTATLDGHQTGCTEEGKAVFGTARPNKNGVYGVDRGTEYVTFNEYPTHAVINKNHTWVFYRVSAGAIFVLNSGTWSLGAPPPAKRGLPSSHSSAAALGCTRQARRPRWTSSSTATATGCTSWSPSAGLGSKKLADGYSTGCVSSDVFGSKTKILNKGGTYVLSTNYNGTIMYQYVIFKNHTWVLYGSVLGAEALINSGTWSLAVAKARSGGPSGG